MTAEIIRPTSNYHWYDADGVPHHEAGLRDARKLNLLPSPTTIIGVMKNMGLDIWKQNNLLLSALTFPDEEKKGVELEHLAKRIVEDSKQQGSDAAIRGTAVHLGCEAILKGKNWDREDQQLVAVNDWAQANVLDVTFTEEVVVNKEIGYAGCCDALLDHQEHGKVVADWKTQGCKANSKGEYRPAFYKNWALQGAAYRECINRKLPFLSVVINRNGPEIFEKRWDDEAVDKAFDAFANLHAIWCWEKNYYPGRKPEAAA
jgi:hypothetical protein